MSGFDEGFERLTRGLARNTSRRSLLSRFGAEMFQDVLRGVEERAAFPRFGI